LLDGAESRDFETSGLNPVLLSAAEIAAVLEQSDLVSIKNRVTKLFFYGAGCSSLEQQANMRAVLQKYFPEAKISVESDLLGAARATCKNEKGIVCILGTGSNAAYFDGQDLHTFRPSLGYMLGDEGSGMHIGKRLLQDFFDGLMPEMLAKQFGEGYDLNRETVLDNLYNKPRPNAYMASFAKFASIHPSTFTNGLVQDCFRAFFAANVLPIPDKKSLPIHFIGSIASNFDFLLSEVMIQFGLVQGLLVQKPIFNLGEYHQKQSDL